jgi:DNA-binding transcriptional regulator PaaX
MSGKVDTSIKTKIETNKTKTSVEAVLKTRTRRHNIRRIVFSAFYVGVAAGLAVMAPNTLQLLKHVEKSIGSKPRLNRRLSQAVSRMIAAGLIIREHTRSGSRLRLTKKGEQVAQDMYAEERALPNIPRRWDRKWRIIIFDIWERRRAVRDQLRMLLRRVGFVKMQGSVWVYPYDCEEIHMFAKTHFRVGGGMIYIIADEIENDTRLLKHFNLIKE